MFHPECTQSSDMNSCCCRLRLQTDALRNNLDGDKHGRTEDYKGSTHRFETSFHCHRRSMARFSLHAQEDCNGSCGCRFNVVVHVTSYHSHSFQRRFNQGLGLDRSY